MSGLIEQLPFEPRASARAPKHKDTSGTCRERATADLLRSVAMITPNERLSLERSAASWELRAQLLDRLAQTERARGEAASQKLRA